MWIRREFLGVATMGDGADTIGYGTDTVSRADGGARTGRHPHQTGRAGHDPGAAPARPHGHPATATQYLRDRSPPLPGSLSLGYPYVLRDIDLPPTESYAD